MEQDLLPMNGPNPGMYGSDRDLFSRVWRRVMPENLEGCPIELNAEDGAAFGMVPSPGASNIPFPTAKNSEEPTPDGICCLGAASAVYGGQLQAFLALELEDWSYYQTLAGRAGPGAARVIYGIAADERRHAKKLSAALFLISGVRCWPDHPPAFRIPEYLGALRRRFGEEQKGAGVYRKAAEKTADLCLHELYLELADEEARHAQLIRAIIEQL